MTRIEVDDLTSLFGFSVPPFIVNILLVVAAVVAALVIHVVAAGVFRRLAARTSSKADDPFVERAVAPTRWLLIGIALSFVRPALDLLPWLDQLWGQAAGMAVPALLGWLAVNMVHAAQDAIFARADISVADNLTARRIRTRGSILARIAIILIVFVVVCLMLFSIPTVRTVGVTLMASAGLAALAVGAAAQPVLKNVIAGMQLAFTEPIRIDDVVIIAGEWGRIEEIHLTYVIVAIWDERRLVVPVSKFMEESFQNWTRTTSQLLGTIYWYLDPATDIDRLRAAFEKIVTAEPLFDGRAQGLVVSDTKPDAIEVRGIATARNSGEAWDLRCAVREKLLAYIRREMPDAMPRNRALLARDGARNESGEGLFYAA